MASTEPVHLLAKLAAVPLPAPLASELAPLLTLFEPLDGEIAAADRRLEQRAAADLVAARPATAPSVGPVTATAFVATLDDVRRFTSAHPAEAYLGLTPGEHSSGDQQHRGRLTKTGNTRARWLLVQAGWRLLRSTQPEAAALRAWGEQVAPHRWWPQLSACLRWAPPSRRIPTCAVALRLDTAEREQKTQQHLAPRHAR